MTESEDDKGPFDPADRTCVLRPSLNLRRDGLQPKHCTALHCTHALKGFMNSLPLGTILKDADELIPISLQFCEEVHRRCFDFWRQGAKYRHLVQLEEKCRKVLFPLEGGERLTVQFLACIWLIRFIFIFKDGALGLGSILQKCSHSNRARD